MKTPALIFLMLAMHASTLRGQAPAVAGGPTDQPGPFLRVAAVQMRSGADWRANVAKIKGFLADCAVRKVQILAIPECAVSSYDAAAIKALTPEDIAAAEREIAAACREHAIAAVIGIPELRGGGADSTTAPWSSATRANSSPGMTRCSWLVRTRPGSARRARRPPPCSPSGRPGPRWSSATTAGSRN